MEDSLALYAFPHLERRKISSTNLLERLNRKICRRISDVGIYPNPDIGHGYRMDYLKNWPVSIVYFCAQSLRSAQTNCLAFSFRETFLANTP